MRPEQGNVRHVLHCSSTFYYKEQPRNTVRQMSDFDSACGRKGLDESL